MKKTLPFLLPLLLLLAACENTVDTDGWPAHEEKLVVTGYLRVEDDSIFAYARVNRTLPLGERYDPAGAIINDADLIVESGNRTFPLIRAQGFYPFDFDFNYGGVTSRGSDDRFTLHVTRDGKSAVATLQLQPAVLRFDSAWIQRSTERWGDSYKLHFLLSAPGADMDVECRVEYWTEDFGVWYEMTSFMLANYSNLPNGKLEGTADLWTFFDGHGTKPRIRYTLIARNRAYQDYINSRWEWNTGDSPFDPPQKNPPFNVTGDGIGFFWYEIVGEPVEIPY